MPESKLKQSMQGMLSPKNGKPEDNNQSYSDNDEFAQASKNTPKSELDAKVEPIKLGKQKSDESPKEKNEPISIETAKKGVDKKEADKPDSNKKISKVSKPDKPVKIPPIKQSNKRNYLGGLSLTFSIVAILAAGYSIYEQKQSQALLQETLDVIGADISELSLKTDDIAVSIIKVKDQVKYNANNIAKNDSIQDSISDLDREIQNKLEDIELMEGRMDQQGKTLKTHGDELRTLGKKINNFSARKPTVRKAVKRASIKKVVDDPLKIGGDAVVASIDTWGTEPYVMLRSDDGEWVPIAMGDYYKGWRLSGVIGTKAVFKKGKKIRKLAIEG